MSNKLSPSIENTQPIEKPLFRNTFLAIKTSLISNFEHQIYSIMTKTSYYQLFFYEVMGMFIVMFGRNCQKNEQHLGSLQFICFFFAICLTGLLSGANLNPAVTLSNCIRKQNKYKWKMLPLYCIAQLTGCLLALALSDAVNDHYLPSLQLDQQNWISVVRVFFNQLIGTMVIVFFLLQISNPNTTFIQNQISGYLVSSFIMFMGIIMAPKNIAVNPAFIISQAIYAAFRQQFQGLKWIILYTIAAILGAIISTKCYDHLFEPTIRKQRQKRRLYLSFVEKSLCQQ